MGRESTLQSKCIAYLKRSHIYCINIYGSGRCAKGAPDLIACIGGLFVAFEFKVGKNGLQEDQKYHKAHIEGSGGSHYTPRSFEEFKSIVDELKESNNERRIYHT